jgi:hypothetical protein
MAAPSEPPAAASPERVPMPAITDTGANDVSAVGPSEAEAGPTVPAAGLAAANGRSAARPRARLAELSAFSVADERVLRKYFGKGTPQTRVVFHDAPPMSTSDQSSLAHLALPILYNPSVNGLEDARELPVEVGTLLIGRYRVVAVIGKGSFSRVFQCLDLRHKTMVSVKVRTASHAPTPPMHTLHHPCTPARQAARHAARGGGGGGGQRSTSVGRRRVCSCEEARRQCARRARPCRSARICVRCV